MTITGPSPTPRLLTLTTSEAEPIAHELNQSFGELAHAYQKHYKLYPDEAKAKASEVGGAEVRDRLLDCDPREVMWGNLDQLARDDPRLALERWNEIKKAAGVDLRSGHRAAKAINGSEPWSRAQFLAVREELAAEWKPRNGIERQLIDTMAQALAGEFFWMERLTERSSLEGVDSGQMRRCWKLPTVTAIQAIDQAAGMVDRFNRIFMRTLRTLRALRNLRRYTPLVIVQNAEQVNVAEQQMNVTVDLPENSPAHSG